MAQWRARLGRFFRLLFTSCDAGLPSREQSSNLLPRRENNARLGYKCAQRNSRDTNTGFQSPGSNATARLNSGLHRGAVFLPEVT